jgi:hypothetical protein
VKLNLPHFTNIDNLSRPKSLLRSEGMFDCQDKQKQFFSGEDSAEGSVNKVALLATKIDVQISINGSRSPFK